MGERMARLPWTKEEVKTLLKQDYVDDERQVIDMLKRTGSTACCIYSELRLNRSVIKTSLKELKDNRLYQVALAGILCATRFKYFEGSCRFPVRCQISSSCQEEDSFPHLLKCIGLSIPKGGDSELVTFLTGLAKQATIKNPGLPEPIRDVRMGEFEIEFPPSPDRSDGEISL